MRLFKGVWATVITAIGLTLAFSVTQGWNWPFLADARSGIIALGVVGLAACSASGSAAASFSIKDPLVILAIAIGIGLFAVGIVGLFVNTMPYLIVMMVATVGLWLVATTRRLVEANTKTHRVTAA